jgi:hypothetical protein
MTDTGGGIAAALEKARAEVARLERAASQATCAELGRHTWALMGGRNCGCVDDEGRAAGNCSVPVYHCSVCGDCDNPEAKMILDQCRISP